MSSSAGDAGGPHSNESGGSRGSDFLVPGAVVWRQLMDLLSLDQNIAWLDGATFDQLVVQHHDDHVLVMVKAVKRSQPVIAFLACDDLAGALVTVGEFAAKGVLSWKVDKWPSKRVKSLLR